MPIQRPFYSIDFDSDEILNIVKKNLPNCNFVDHDTLINTFTCDVNYLYQQCMRGDKFIIIDKNVYKINSVFHITTLFVGNKPHELSKQFDEQGVKQVKITINKIAISENFITLGVADFDALYYGNPIKHITFAISQCSPQKLFPKDSPTAFNTGKIIDIECEIIGVTH